jgi:hypothetical protein
MLPAGVVDSIDPDTETVFASLSKDEIKDSPEHDELRRDDETYRGDLGTYYGSHRTMRYSVGPSVNASATRNDSPAGPKRWKQQRQSG